MPGLWEQVFLETRRCFGQQLNPSLMDPGYWRALATGEARSALQQYLLSVAAGAHVGTRADSLGIYMAAHSVLPLHGRDLDQLATLMIEYVHSGHTVRLEWAPMVISTIYDECPRCHMLKSEIAGIIRQMLRENAQDPLCDAVANMAREHLQVDVTRT
ncbi:MAG: hypothetical protein ACOX44_16935 [Limnochordia bacterium]|jgi:hypothetical protein